jgi:hypothetical protein
MSVWVAGATLVAGVYSANKADKANKRGVNAAMSAAEMERETALDTLNYYRERDSQSFSLQRESNAISRRVANSQVALMDQQKQQSGEYFSRLKSVFWPVEDQLVKDATEYDTQARRDGESAEAVAEVGMQTDAAKAANERQMMRMGVNPAAARFQAMNNQIGLQAATAKAGAGNAARDKVEQQGWARRLDVTALGKGLPGASNSSASTSTGAGNAAVSAAQAPLAGFNSQTQIMGNAMQNYGNALTGSFDRISAANNSQASMWGQAASGFGSLAGSAMGIYAANNKSTASPTSGSTYLYSPTAAQPAADYSLGASGYKLGAS